MPSLILFLEFSLKVRKVDPNARKDTSNDYCVD